MYQPPTPPTESYLRCMLRVPAVHLRREVAVGVMAEQGWLPEQHLPNDFVGGVHGEPLELGGQVVLGAERKERREPALAANKHKGETPKMLEVSMRACINTGG